MWTEAIRAIPLAVTLFVGSNQQTPSDHLTPIPDLYHIDASQGLKQSLRPGDKHQPFLLLLDDGVLTTYTDRAHWGTRLNWLELAARSQTGGRSFFRSVAPHSPVATEQPSVPHVSIAAQPPPEQARAVRWLVNTAGLSASRVGEIVGADRVRVQQWKAGASISAEHLRRLMETRDVLSRAMRRHSDKDALAAWLVTPDAHAGVSPERLLKQGEFDQARLLAVLSPSNVEPMPEWASRPVAEAWRGTGGQRQRPGEFFDD